VIPTNPLPPHNAEVGDETAVSRSSIVMALAPRPSSRKQNYGRQHNQNDAQAPPIVAAHDTINAFWPPSLRRPAKQVIIPSARSRGGNARTLFMSTGSQGCELITGHRWPGASSAATSSSALGKTKSEAIPILPVREPVPRESTAPANRNRRLNVVESRKNRPERPAGPQVVLSRHAQGACSRSSSSRRCPRSTRRSCAIEVEPARRARGAAAKKRIAVSSREKNPKKDILELRSRRRFSWA